MGTSGLALVDVLRHLTAPRDASTERILDAALACFAEGDIRGVTMNQIAARAGLGVATVYRRFPRKRDLVQAVMLREARRLIDGVDAAVSRHTRLEDQVTEGFVAFVAELNRRAVFADALQGGTETLPMLTAGAAPFLDLGRGYLAGLIRRWQEVGVAVDLDADIVAEVFARLAHSLALTPEGVIPTHDQAAMRDFARNYLIRIVDGG
jgi:TetR/AcrR family transcriptional regulator, repressor for uid operon